MYIATVGYLFYFYYLTKYKLTLVTGGYQVIFIIIYNITDTLVQFKVLDHVLLVFKNLYDIQTKEVECIKLQKYGVMMIMMTKMKKLMILNRSLIKSTYLLPFMVVQDIEKN
jgi:hypothetical protein